MLLWLWIALQRNGIFMLMVQMLETADYGLKLAICNNLFSFGGKPKVETIWQFKVNTITTILKKMAYIFQGFYQVTLVGLINCVFIQKQFTLAMQ